jgi:glycyl-tRNA synthetase beta chain
MAERKDFLVEIGTEELPPKALPRLSRAFAAGLRNGLTRAGLTHGEVIAYATPRRLAVLVKELSVQQPDQEIERRGPALSAAFDADGNPTKAAEGFARSCGVSVGELGRLETDKGTWLAYHTVEKGRPAAELIPAVVEQSLAALPIPKRMRWGAGEAEFVRPVHWIVLLLGEEVIPAELFGIQAGRHTRGHRFHAPDPIYLGEAAAYAPLLETEGRVLADFAARREAIRGQVEEAAAREGARAVMDEELLDEVTALVEWPVAVVGSFEERFLQVPQEALMSSMEEHQKMFPMVDAEDRLLPRFITIANIESRDPEQVRAGNERVIRPRLADAAFFWEQDGKTPLADRLEKLKDMVFQKKLGTLYDKTQRTMTLAAAIATELGGNPDHARRGAQLAKCDLLTNMVYEFPELQGIMGRHYALRDGEVAEVALAIDEQYMPRFAGDELASSVAGRAVGMADRLDTLVGSFAIGQRPKGDKDPLALRRAALGVLRTLVEGELELDLLDLLRQAAKGLEGTVDAGAAVTEVFEFMIDRLRAYYQDAGIQPDVFDAVAARRPTRPYDFHRRLHAVSQFRLLPEAEALAAANKRIRNILRKAEGDIPQEVDPSLLRDAAEQNLARAVEEAATDVTPLIAAADYAQALSRLARLRGAVDDFFDQVMVMVDEEALRNNRLALLKRLSEQFLMVADISRLQG